MTTTIGIRELVRNSKIIDQYDYIEIEDKKTHEYKGIFISAKYAKEFKEYIDNKLSQSHNEKINRLLSYTSKDVISKEFENMSNKEIKSIKSLEKFNDK